MNTRTSVPVICLLLLVAAIGAGGCTSASAPEGKTTPSTGPATVTATIAAATPGQSACGITSCHGLDLACGYDAPQICTMEYRLGDKCRQYARCENTAAGCTLVKEARFDTCKTCVEQCQAAAQDNPVMAFSCEEKC